MLHAIALRRNNKNHGLNKAFKLPTFTNKATLKAHGMNRCMDYTLLYVLVGIHRNTNKQRPQTSSSVVFANSSRCML